MGDRLIRSWSRTLSTNPSSPAATTSFPIHANVPRRESEAAIMMAHRMPGAAAAVASQSRRLARSCVRAAVQLNSRSLAAALKALISRF